MKNLEIEEFNKALSDKNLRVKFLSVDDYLKLIFLSKEVSAEIDRRAETLNKLIEDYNKDFTNTVKSEAYKKLIEKKKKEGEEKLTEEEKEMLDIKPAVTLIDNGRMTGPSDFIDKVNKMRAQEFKVKPLNFIRDAKAFKAMVEETEPQVQRILFEFLYKK